MAIILPSIIAGNSTEDFNFGTLTEDIIHVHSDKYSESGVECQNRSDNARVVVKTSSLTDICARKVVQEHKVQHHSGSTFK